jgi:hypothetical protein
MLGTGVIRMITRSAFIIASAMVVAVAGCSGNLSPRGSSVIPIEQSQRGSFANPFTTLTATFTIQVPSNSLNAKSASISANGGTPVVQDLSPTASGCVPAHGSHPLTCTVAVSARLGRNVFVLKTFSAPGGGGSVLATATIFQTLSSNITIPVILSATPASIALALANAAPRECDPATNIPLYIAVKDASGNIIVTANYGLTITLHDSDTSGTTTLSATTVTSSGANVTLHYNGHLLKTATISASAPGISRGNIHNAIFTPTQLLYVLDIATRGDEVYLSSATGNVKPVRQFSSTAIDSNLTEGFLSSACVIYISDESAVQQIAEFSARANGPVAPLATIAGSNTNLFAGGVAVDSSGKIYSPIDVGGTPGLGIWAAGASGNVAPSAMIFGSKTQIGNPGPLTFGPSGKLYLLSFRNVLVFAKGATGNVAPLQNVTTNFFCPSGVGVDSTGEIYVPDNCANQIKVFAADANGNATPIATINTGQSSFGAGLDYHDNLYTAFLNVPAVASYLPGANGNAHTRTLITGNMTLLREPSDPAP